MRKSRFTDDRDDDRAITVAYYVPIGCAL